MAATALEGAGSEDGTPGGKARASFVGEGRCSRDRLALTVPALSERVRNPVPYVSVIIPVLDDFARLRQCLEALAAQTLPQERFEVLVVDNGSRSDPHQELRGYDFVRVLEERAPGSYAARNAGLAEARGDVLAFTDSDCLPAPHWLSAGVEAVQRLGPEVVVGGRVELFAEQPERPTLAEEFELALGFSQERYINARNYSVTANLFTTPQTFARVGRFDASLRSGGDKQWGNRAHAAGVPLHYCEAALVRHPARRSMQELFRKRARVVGGHLNLARSRYPGWIAFSLVLGKACAPPVARLTRVRPPDPSGTTPRRSATSPMVSSHGCTENPNVASSRWQRAKRLARVGFVGVSLQAFSALEVVRLQLGKPPAR